MSFSFIGLGAMGYHLAGHLARSGKTTVWNRTEAIAMQHCKQFGSSMASDVSQCGVASFVFLCLPSSNVVGSVVELLKPRLSVGTIVVDCTSGDPNETKSIAADLAASGVSMVDAPVSGGPAGAEAGTLTTMVGGEAHAVAKAKPLLSLFCKHVRHVGGPGSGHAIKAINNALNASHLVMAAEGFLSLAKQGVEPTGALEVVNTSSGRSLQTEVRIPQDVLSGRFNYGFKVGLMLKDVRIATKICPSPYFQRTEEILVRAVEQEGFDADYTCAVKVLERDFGIEMRGKNHKSNL